MMNQLRELQKEVEKINEEHGWNDETRTVGDLIALMHSELSEALEEFRKGNAPNFIYYSENKPEGVGIELADCVIRIMHFCSTHNLDLFDLLLQKIRYNITRPYKHGGKVI